MILEVILLTFGSQYLLHFFQEKNVFKNAFYGFLRFFFFSTGIKIPTTDYRCFDNFTGYLIPEVCGKKYWLEYWTKFLVPDPALMMTGPLTPVLKVSLVELNSLFT